MPVYSYRCGDCGKTFEREEHVSEHDTASVQCPKCKSNSVKQVLTPFHAKTAKKS